MFENKSITKDHRIQKKMKRVPNIETEIWKLKAAGCLQI